MIDRVIRNILFSVLCMLILTWMLAQAGIAEQIMLVNNTRVNLRSSPTASADNILSTVSENTRVTIVARQGTWCQVRLPDGQEGWISARVLTPVSESPSIPSRRGLELPSRQEAPASQATPSLAAMVLIPGGTAILGSDPQEIDVLARAWKVSSEMFQDEIPRKMVTIQSFYLDQYEVTNAQYKAFVEATRYPPPLHWHNGVYPDGTADHPVTYISWDQAQAYAEWAGKRLPTAEEWELAARGLRGQSFPWGNTFTEQNVNIGKKNGSTAAVGTHPDDVSEYRVYDLGGNVMEWTMTPYQDSRDFFVLKGSSWNGDPVEARGANQTPGEAIYQLGHIGFRCAKSAAQ